MLSIGSKLTQFVGSWCLFRNVIHISNSTSQRIDYCCRVRTARKFIHCFGGRYANLQLSHWDFFLLCQLSFFPYSLFSLSSCVFFLNFILAVPMTMHKCLEINPYMSSTFPIAIENGIGFFFALLGSNLFWFVSAKL